MMNKYAMTLARQALTAKDVRPVSPDKSDRIRDMVSGHTASMDRWLPMSKTAEGEEESSSGAPAAWKPTPLWDRKWKDIPGEERALLGLGVAGGGIAGYALARLLHRKRNKWRTLAYVLGGAGGGLFGMDKLLDLPGEKGEDGKEGPSWRTEHLVKDTPGKKIKEQSEQQLTVAHENETDWGTVQHAASLIAMGVGGVQAGAEKGLYHDFSGRRMADNAARQAWLKEQKTGANYADTVKAELKLPAAVNKLTGKWYDWLIHPIATRKVHAMERALNGRKIVNNEGQLTGVTMDGWTGVRDAGMDIGGNAFLYGLGSESLGYLMRWLGANVNNRDRAVQKAVTPNK